MKGADPAGVVEQAAEAALTEIARLREDLVDRETRLEQLREVCEQRAQVITKLDDALKRARQNAAEARPPVDVAAIRAQLEGGLREIDRARRERDELALAAETARRELEDERLRTLIGAQQREAELLQARRDAESMRARVESLNGTLTARTVIIAELQQACEERLALIERLSHELEAHVVAKPQPVTAPDDGVDWRRIAEERDAALTALSAEAEQRAVLLAEVTAALQDRTLEIEDLRKRRGRT
jgi:DNA repair exonuclease SbcCD ATPase subunit